MECATEDEESASSGCVTETDEEDASATSSIMGSETSSDSSGVQGTNGGNGNSSNGGSAEQSGRVVVEKTELAPILEDEVLEIEPTPVATVATTPVGTNGGSIEDQQNSNVNSFAVNTNVDLAPVYEDEELEGDGNKASTPHPNVETSSLMSPNDDAISITTSTDFHRQRSYFGGTHPELLNRLLGSDIGADDDDEAPHLPYQGAPNGGYGWFITLISFITFMIAEGTFYSFGVFFPEFIRAFNAQESLVVWIGSVASGASYLSGPVGSILVDKFGLRPVALGGCLLGTVSLGLCIFVPTVHFLIVTWGLLFGISSIISALPCHFALSLWFDTKRGLATGLGIAGGGLGSVIFPPMVSLLIFNFSWKAAMLVLCVTYFSMTLALAFLKPVPAIPLPDSHMSLSDIVEQNDMNVFHNPGRLRLQAFRKAAFSINSTANNSMWRLSQENVTGGQTSVNDIATIGRSQFSLENSQMHLGSSFLEKPEPQKKLSSYSNFMQHFLWNQNRKPSRGVVPTEELLGSQNLVNEASLGNSKSENLNRTPVPPASPGTEIPTVLVSSKAVDDNQVEDNINETKLVPPRRPLRRLDIFYSGSTLNLEKVPRSIINLNSQWTFQDRSENLGTLIDLNAKENKTEKVKSPDSSGQSVVEMVTHLLNVKLMQQISFSLFALAYFIFMLGFFIPFVYLPTLVQETLEGFTQEQASYFIPLIGVTNMVGRLVMGIVGGMGLFDPCYLNAMSFLACGLSTMVIPFCDSLTMFVVYALTFGFFCGL
ncbi:uncharacterized protein LOC142337810 isoform X2 [Convolutriloba macropyga]|uniref:uncharacterized protein LOC142337810 isoform X2 n=1 Tax=Convolutriloba macropyga TaxID=536237 RepID=UPI003F51F372